MSKSDKVVPIEQAEANLPATRGDLKKLEDKLTGRMDKLEGKVDKLDEKVDSIITMLERNPAE